jgi:DNA modification methylase
LTCGSAYNYLDNIATAIITDPPYGIDYAPDWKKCDGSPSDFKKIEGDQKEFDPRPFLNRETVVLFGANYFTRHLPQGFWICWDKRTKDELDDMFGSPFELAWFKSPKTTKAAIMIRVLHGGVVNADAVYGYDASRSHPTQKPIILFEDILKKLTNEGETVCDPFCGSGTTLLAAENTGRTCIAYEIDPAYCNVILQRYVQLTNQTPWKV